MRTTVQLALVVLIASVVSAECSAEPISLDDIKQMRRARKTHRMMIDVIRERGLAFAVDADGQKQLRRFGFSLKQVGQIEEIARNAPKPAKGAAVPDKPPAAVAAPKLELDPQTEAVHARTEDWMKRTIAGSGTDVKMHDSAHIRLIATDKLAKQYTPMVRGLENLLKKRFPDPIANGVDRRAANIALFATRYEYEKWVRSQFKVLEEDGMTIAGEDILNRMIRTDSFFLPGMYNICLEKKPQDYSRRRVAFAVGYQYMRQLTNQKAPEAMAAGFGDVTETMMFGWPSIMVKSGYVEREIGGKPVFWARLLDRRFANGLVPSLEELMNYRTDFMEHPHYAESWSFTSWLASDPKQLAELIVQLRQGKVAKEEIERLYNVDENTFKPKLVAFNRSLR